MQTNPYPIVAIDNETDLDPEVITCACSHGNEKKVGACICTDCKCHLRRRNREIDYIIMPMPPPRIQYIGYGIIVSTVTIIAVYMLLQPK
jgi:hypothetical protein